MNSTQKALWEIWRDFTSGSKTWRMKTPVGVLAFNTKKEASGARAEYERRKEQRERADAEVPYRAAFSRLADGAAMVVFQSNAHGHQGMPLSWALAAPDMFNAIKHAVKIIASHHEKGEEPPYYDALLAAIKKAEGK
jgi:hypothetical protein